MRSAANSSAIVFHAGGARAAAPLPTTRPVSIWRNSEPTGPAARLGADVHGHVARAQRFAEQARVRGGAGAVDAFEHDEMSKLHDGSQRACTAALNQARAHARAASAERGATRAPARCHYSQ